MIDVVLVFWFYGVLCNQLTGGCQTPFCDLFLFYLMMFNFLIYYSQVQLLVTWTAQSSSPHIAIANGNTFKKQNDVNGVLV
jgi:hypothetical protein